MTNQFLRAALGCACALSLAACTTGYGREGFLGGYSERQEEPGLWRVQAVANGFTRADTAGHMALYRSAELARAAGYSHFQVLHANVRVTQLVSQYGTSMGSGGERARLRIRGVNAPDAPTACEMKPGSCQTFSVEEVMADLAPLLNIRQSPSRQASR